MAKEWVYLFNGSNANMRELLGGKGANPAETIKTGLPMPQGLTITTEACAQRHEDGREINAETQSQINDYIAEMERITGRKFGDKENPLLVSVRFSAKASVPGMMDTILNLSLNEDTVKVLAEKSNNSRWAWDCYRRFIQMYFDVVIEVGKKYFEELIDKMKEERGMKQDIDPTTEDLHELANQFKAEYKEKLGQDSPPDPKEQLMGATKAAFRSWDNPHANVYRRDNDILYFWGTAVNVQSMVFGSTGDDCGTGVAFTRDPVTGKKGLFGEPLTNAQGEDVAAGVRTSVHINEIEQKFPEVLKQFVDVYKTLEEHYRDMQGMELIVERGKLYVLQTRNGKRTAKAALKVACDLVDKGMRSEREAVAVIDPRNLNILLHPQFDQKASKVAIPLGKGLGTSPDAIYGKVVFTTEGTEVRAERGKKVVLIRLEISPEDIINTKSSQGILTVHGGMTSHAVVAARDMGKCCVFGLGGVVIDEVAKKFSLGGQTFHEGDPISVDGTTDNVYASIIPTVDATTVGEFGRIMTWADKYRKLKVRTNMDTPADTKKARELSAEGIGLYRTEHMFSDSERTAIFHKMICSDTFEEKEEALVKILLYQQKDSEALYEVTEGNSATIRFPDPPLHEFVPTKEIEVKKLVDAKYKTIQGIKNIIVSLHKSNPMTGYRSCCLAVTYPEIAATQTKVVTRAATVVEKSHPDWKLVLEVMIPLVSEDKELKFVKKTVVETMNAEIKATGSDLKYEVGMMIEIPRACVTASAIAKDADFFCFGTSDLTQMTFSFSRDDTGKFLNACYDTKIFESDPFAKLDQVSVGKPMKMVIELGRPVSKDLRIGVCGEHGGDSSSVEFCDEIGLDYVSCSPLRVPVAKFAAAQAAIKKG